MATIKRPKRDRRAAIRPVCSNCQGRIDRDPDGTFYYHRPRISPNESQAVPAGTVCCDDRGAAFVGGDYPAGYAYAAGYAD